MRRVDLLLRIVRRIEAEMRGEELNLRAAVVQRLFHEIPMHVSVRACAAWNVRGEFAELIEDGGIPAHEIAVLFRAELPDQADHAVEILLRERMLVVPRFDVHVHHDLARQLFEDLPEA